MSSADNWMTNMSVTLITEHGLVIAKGDGGREGVETTMTSGRDMDDTNARVGEADMATLPTTIQEVFLSELSMKVVPSSW